MGGRGVATAGIIPTTHASFLREPGGADPLRPARRSIYRGDICLRCTKIALAHESFCYFLIFCFFVVRHARRLKFSIVIHWFLRVKENFWLDVID